MRSHILSMREKLKTLPVKELREIAKVNKIKGSASMKKDELIEAIIASTGSSENEERMETKNSEESLANVEKQFNTEKHINNDNQGNEEIKQGILEVLADGYGFIRCENYLPGEEDVYVSPAQIRRFNLKTGDILTGKVRPKRNGENYGGLQFLERVNGYDAEVASKRKAFEDLTPVFPNERIILENETENINENS